MKHIFYGGPGYNWKNAAMFDTIGERFDIEFRELHEWLMRDKDDGNKHIIALMNYKAASKYFCIPPSPGYDGIYREYLWNSEYNVVSGLDIAMRHIEEPFESFIKHREKKVLPGQILTKSDAEPLLYALREEEDYILAPVNEPHAEIRVWVIDGQIQRWSIYMMKDGFNLTRFRARRFDDELEVLLGAAFTDDWIHKYGSTFSFDVALSAHEASALILEVHLPHSVGDYGGYSYDLVEWLEASTRWLEGLEWVYKG